MTTTAKTPATAGTPARKTVEIKNIGVIKELLFDLPDDSGGVLVLKGANRVGKSTAIKILRALLSGKGRLETRDGAVRGVAEAFGQRVSVSSQTRFAGESQVESLEGKFDFSDLVHPEAKEPETRDKIRIKALLSLTGAAADAAIFYGLVGSQAAFEKLVPAESIKKKDLVELAGVVHRALHSAAQLKESEAEFELGHARSCKDQAGGIEEVNGQIDIHALHRASNDAAGELRSLTERAAEAADLIIQRQESVQSLERVRACYDGPSIERAAHEVQQTIDSLNAAEEELATLRKRLTAAEKTVGERTAEFRQASERQKTAQQHQVAVAAIERAIDTAAVQIAAAPSSEQIAAATTAAEKASGDLEMAVTIRDAQQKLSQAGEHEATAAKATSEATRLREAARSVDHVLSQKLPQGPLRAEGGRLVLDTERGESAPYDDCSDGEKWLYALPYGIDAVTREHADGSTTGTPAGIPTKFRGVIAVSQDAWQDLDTTNRLAIAEKAAQSHIWIITGEVADGELRAEVFQV